MRALLLRNILHRCQIQRNTNNISHNMETSLSEWEHQSALCKHRRFYKHCCSDVTSDGRKWNCLRFKVSGLLNTDIWIQRYHCGGDAEMGWNQLRGNIRWNTGEMCTLSKLRY